MTAAALKGVGVPGADTNAFSAPRIGRLPTSLSRPIVGQLLLAGAGRREVENVDDLGVSGGVGGVKTFGSEIGEVGVEGNDTVFVGGDKTGELMTSLGTGLLWWLVLGRLPSELNFTS